MSGPADDKPAAESEDYGYNLQLYGNEQILRGCDTGVLVAFAALAFQQIRDDKQPHYNVAFGFLLVSVLLCAVVHFCIGNAYIGRARRLIHKQQESARQRLVRGTYTTLAWAAGLVQLACIVIGLLLLLPEPPALLKEYWPGLFPPGN